MTEYYSDQIEDEKIRIKHYSEQRIKEKMEIDQKKNLKRLKDNDFIKSIRILYYEEKEVRKELPEWIPLNEYSLVLFLSRNPKIFSESAKLIGIEIYRIDMLFEDNDNLYVVETKYCNGYSSDRLINDATLQLKRYCNILKKKNINKKINPIIVIMINNKEGKENKIKTNKCIYCGKETYNNKVCSLECLETYIKQLKQHKNRKMTENKQKTDEIVEKIHLIRLFNIINS